MELTKNTINICDTVAKGRTQAMTDGDVIVPDTKPDILKLIQVDSDASITDKYIENGRLILCGRVVYKILYVPDRENEKIKSIETSMEFRQAVDVGNTDAERKILSKPAVERVEFNTVNSRKLRLRAIINIDYEVLSMGVAELASDACDDILEKKTENISFEDVVNVSEHEFTVKERLEIPSGERSVNELLKTDVKLYDTEYKPVTGKVIVKGIVAVCVLYTDDEGDIKFTESEIPFTEVLDAIEVSENSVCDIDYSVLDVMSCAEPDIDGDLREINLDIDISAAMKATNTVDKEILIDCYMPFTKTVCEKEKVSLCSTIESPSSQNTIRDIVEIPTNAPQVSEVYNVMTNVVVSKTVLERNKIICEGKTEVYILYLTESIENPIHSLKKEIPFSFMIDCKNDTNGLVCELKSQIKHASYSINSSGEIEIRCLLAIDCMLTKEIKIENITEIMTEESDTRQGIIIYFARAGEKIWDIAKMYKVPCHSLEELNETKGERIEADRKLIIPMK